ncbi:MAG: hypothetical protein NTX50_17900 [Candidatus Sumerlaeota bacterium]|nr:hypothetical protein [Candidatus Sumerlaeota bacterium]
MNYVLHVFALRSSWRLWRGASCASGGLVARFALSFACALSLALLQGCSKTQFLENFQPPPPQPLVMEGFTLHHTKAGLETQRILGETAKYFDDRKQMEITRVQTYFYDGKEPNSQIRYLRSDMAILYMSDQTTSGGFLKGDIEFIGNIVFIDRPLEFRMETSKARYHDRLRLMESDLPTTRAIMTEKDVLEEHGKKGFHYDMNTSSTSRFPMYESHAIKAPLETREATLAKMRAEIVSIPWVCGPDDAAIAVYAPKEEKR